MIPFYEYLTNHFQISTGTEINFPPHLHSATELLYVRRGEIVTQHGGQTETVGAEEMMLFFPNNVHSYITTNSNTYFSMIIYRGKLCEEIEKIFSTKAPLKYHLHKDEIPPEVILTINSLEKSQKNHDSALIIKLYFELIWARLFPIIDLQKKEASLPNDLLVSVLSFITEHFTETITLEILSKKFGVSRYKISRLFTGNINIGLNEYINTMRIDKAKSLLQNHEISVIDVAFACGFESQQTFNRVFKNITGTKPKDFRKELNI